MVRVTTELVEEVFPAERVCKEDNVWLRSLRTDAGRDRVEGGGFQWKALPEQSHRGAAPPDQACPAWLHPSWGSGPALSWSP